MLDAVRHPRQHVVEQRGVAAANDLEEVRLEPAPVARLRIDGKPAPKIEVAGDRAAGTHDDPLVLPPLRMLEPEVAERHPFRCAGLRLYAHRYGLMQMEVAKVGEG